MTEIFSFVFDRLTDPLGLPIDAWKEWLILLGIGELAYIIAFYVVGGMYDAGDISTGIGGIVCHWLIRLVVFVIMWAVTYGAIQLWRFCAAHWAIVVSVLGALLLCGIVGLIIRHKMKGGMQNA